MLNFVAKVALQVGLTAANMALTMSRKIEGPRLDDLKFTSGDYGNPLAMVWGMRRIQAPIFWAEDLKEVKQERKTKGGKYNQYTYYGTWAIALAGHEIERITRVWFDTHLVFDLTGKGPVTPFDFGEGGSGGFGKLRDVRDQTLAANYPDKASAKGTTYFAVYLGTETQEPDPRIQATVEAKHGEGSCPAYRGTAYIVFKDIPLEKLGNRIPQVAVEFIANSAATSVPTETHATTYNPVHIEPFRFSGDYSRFTYLGDGGYEIWDTAARAPMITGPITNAGGNAIGLYNDGTILTVGYFGRKLYTIAPGGGEVEILTFATDPQAGCTVVEADGVEHWGTYASSFYGHWYFDGTEYYPGWNATLFFADLYGNVWVIGRIPGATSTCYLEKLVTGASDPGFLDAITLTLSAASPLGDGLGAYATHAHTTDGDQLVVYWNGTIYLVDPFTGTVTASHALAGDTASVYAKTTWANLVPGASTIWQGQSEYSLVTGNLVRTVSAVPSGSVYASVYDPINHAVIVSTITDLTWYFLDRAANNGVTLSTIATALADMVDAQGCDFSDLTQVVKGWSATQGQANAILEPLLDAYDADIRPHGFSLEGLKRSGTSGGTLLTERFKADNPRYSVKVRQAAELPRAITVNFADLDADQQPNNARADRPLDATGARGEKSIDLSTLALDKDEARDLADRYFRRIWNERKEVSLGLTAQQLSLEPGDVRVLDLDGEELTARLVKLTVKADDSLATEWVYDHASLAVLAGGTGANFDGRDPSIIVVPLISKGFVLDVPLLTDAHNSANPLLYVSAAPYAAGSWPGATIYQQTTGGEYSDEIGSIASTSSATWGYANGALADANPNLWDRVSTVNVTIQTGTLTGCTEADIDAAPTRNLALIGDELVNFTTATLEGDGTYTLSGFKRGRRGTEWATGTHAARDVFLLLSHVATAAKGLSDVGTDMSFKAVTSGRTASSAFPISVAPFTGASLKPYAPCHLAGVKDSGTGDWALSWVRRTRVGGAWTSGTSIPLGEASEAYEVELMNGASVAHTYTGLTSPSLTVSSADQTSYLGGPASSLTFRVYQISDAVGRGFVASATV